MKNLFAKKSVSNSLKTNISNDNKSEFFKLLSGKDKKRSKINFFKHFFISKINKLRIIKFRISIFFKKLFSEDVFYVSSTETLPPPLDPESEASLLKNLSEGKTSAKVPLIEHNLRLVVYIARKFENTGILLEDLISIGTIGLIKAINTFDIKKNIKLATYASRCIENEILMYLRKNCNSKSEISIDEPLNTDWDGNELLLSDILGTENDLIYRKIEENTEKELLNSAISKLSEREKQIMKLRFGVHIKGKERTQKEVADMLGISQSYISRLEKRIISRIKKEISKVGAG